MIDDAKYIFYNFGNRAVGFPIFFGVCAGWPHEFYLIQKAANFLKQNDFKNVSIDLTPVYGLKHLPAI